MKHLREVRPIRLIFGNRLDFLMRVLVSLLHLGQPEQFLHVRSLQRRSHAELLDPRPSGVASGQFVLNNLPLHVVLNQIDFGQYQNGFLVAMLVEHFEQRLDDLRRTLNAAIVEDRDYVRVIARVVWIGERGRVKSLIGSVGVL